MNISTYRKLRPFIIDALNQIIRGLYGWFGEGKSDAEYLKSIMNPTINYRSIEYSLRLILIKQENPLSLDDYNKKGNIKDLLFAINLMRKQEWDDAILKIADILSNNQYFLTIEEDKGKSMRKKEIVNKIDKDLAKDLPSEWRCPWYPIPQQLQRRELP